ncbi:MAG TPA: hypothetical protein VMC48_02850 [Methanobacterium sp.]|nr:hypothetical protein [Methanobacterium sp.]
MKKSLPVHPFPDRKNSFKNWVEQIRSSEYLQNKRSTRPVIKSVYIRKSLKNQEKTFQKWDNIQNISRNRYQEKIELMENIRQRKLEDRTINLIYTPRFAYPTSIEGK